MSTIVTARFIVYGDTYDELVTASEDRLSEFFEVDLADIKKTFNYELVVTENENMSSQYSYEATVVVRKRDV
jgi:predicted ATP-grasp superfamily ATP-dependent carboligase